VAKKKGKSPVKLNSPVEIEDRFYLVYSDIADLMNVEGSQPNRPWDSVDMNVTYKGTEYSVSVPFPNSAAQSVALGSEVREAINRAVGESIHPSANVNVTIFGADRG
jgi:hypothetical protein